MSTGHEDELAGQPGTSRGKPLIDPVWFEASEMRRILTERDIGALYHALKDLGVSQRQIAACTGQAQSEVSEILTGRQVRDVTVLERIADGLGIPRGHLRLASGDRDDGAYSGSEGGADPEVDEEMRRRASSPPPHWRTDCHDHPWDDSTVFVAVAAMGQDHLWLPPGAAGAGLKRSLTLRVRRARPLAGFRRYAPDAGGRRMRKCPDEAAR